MDADRGAPVAMDNFVVDNTRGTPLCIETVATIQPQKLAGKIQYNSDKFLIVDSRTFCEYNTSHILNSVNVWSSKIRKKRLQQNSISVWDYLQQASHMCLQERCLSEVVVYDQNATCPSEVPSDSFLRVLLQKLTSACDKVYLLSGGFLEFQSLYPEFCEDCSQKASPLTHLSQPCLPVAKCGPTRILPFLFLGSQNDANNKQLLMEQNINYELNVSTSCPKPEFLQDSHFMRIPVNDNFSEKLLPYFTEAFRFIDKVREAGGRVLVHCLAGISRSPTVAIAFVMKHLHLHYDEAYRYVKNRRPTISPNINFVGQLLELDRQLLKDGVLYRSPTAPIYLDHDFDLLPSPESLLIRSSSSSCVESRRQQKEFPFSPKRSLPSLQLKCSSEFLSSSCQSSPTSPSSALSSLSLFPIIRDSKEQSQEYVSDRLPSTPVTSPTSSPEFFFMEETYANKSAKLSHRVSDSSELLSMREGEGNYFNDHIPVLPCTYSSTSGNTSSTNSSVNVTSTSLRKASFSTTASINLKSAKCELFEHHLSGTDRDHEQICVFEVTHEKSPLMYIDVQSTEPIIVHETQVLATPTSPEVADNNENGTAKEDASVESFPEASLSSKNTTKPQTPVSEENNNNSSSPTTASPPVVAKNPSYVGFSQRKYDPKYLPRSYSSSETHLNTRRLLENQIHTTDANSEAYARKSFSSDEVGRGFQSSCQPTSPLVFNRDIINMTTSDLARCDSWSTSGLGSEISDLESLQEDNHSVLTDDTLGPFDAVFSDVFPGEFQDSVFKESLRKLTPSVSSLDNQDIRVCRSLVETRHNPVRQGRRQQNLSDNKHKSVCATSSLNTTESSSKDSLGSSPTPRPVSLPGVTGTYFTNLKSPSANSNIDMGVEMDDSPDWQHEKGEAICPFSHPCHGQRSSAITEVLSVIPRTAGEDVRHIRERHQLLGDQSTDGSHRPPSVHHQDLLTRRLLRSSSDQCTTAKKSSPKRHSLIITEDTMHGGTDENVGKSSPSLPSAATPSSAKSPLSPFSNSGTEDESKFSFETKERKHSLEQKWRTWDHELKKKIRNIQNNVSLSSWDAEGEMSSTHETSDTITGFHLAQELMQSMEDLLETEISDIKRQASALSTKFGLHLRSSSPPILPVSSRDTSKGVTDPLHGVVDPKSRSTISFCPSLRQGIVRSAKSQNLHKTSWELPTFGSSNDKPKNVPSSFDTVKVSREANLDSVETKLNIHQSPSYRAKSEPPSCQEEGLYRARSCPGIPQGQKENSKEATTSHMRSFSVSLRTSKPSTTFSRDPNRYSCGALDFISPPLSSFESCPDISKIKLFFLDTASASSGASCPSSTHSSSRLLQVS